MDDWEDIDVAELFEALISWMAKGSCTVTAKTSEHTLLLQLDARGVDGGTGRIIGKGGVTIHALRRLAEVGRTKQQRIILEVLGEYTLDRWN